MPSYHEDDAYKADNGTGGVTGANVGSAVEEDDGDDDPSSAGLQSALVQWLRIVSCERIECGLQQQHATTDDFGEHRDPSFRRMSGAGAHPTHPIDVSPVKAAAEAGRRDRERSVAGALSTTRSDVRSIRQKSHVLRAMPALMRLGNCASCAPSLRRAAIRGIDGVDVTSLVESYLSLVERYESLEGENALLRKEVQGVRAAVNTLSF